jgi:hypothetical protein
MNDQFEFDVFLCHNSEDKPEVRKIADALEKQNIKTWLDQINLRPGTIWLDEIQQQIKQIRTVAVFIGKSGVGPWQAEEIRETLIQFKQDGRLVIPVMLAYAPQQPELPLGLNARTWVDFRPGKDTKPIEGLIWGITGKKPNNIPESISRPANKFEQQPRFVQIRLKTLKQDLAKLEKDFLDVADKKRRESNPQEQNNLQLQLDDITKKMEGLEQQINTLEVEHE